MGSYNAIFLTRENNSPIQYGNTGEPRPVETVTYTATIPTISGTSANITVSGILASDNPIVDINWSGSETDTQRDDILEAWGKIYRISTSANTITVYVTEAITVTIPIQLKVVR